MLIRIENYRNIEALDYEIDDGKINYLFGVCGSGKSSIVSAVSKAPIETDTTVGKRADETKVIVDGHAGVIANARVYNASEQETLFRKGATEGAYEIFVGSERVLREHENQFEEAVSELRSFLEVIYSFQGKVQELQSVVGKPSKGQFTKAAKINKAANVAQNTTPFLREVISEGGLEYANWLSQGMTVVERFKESECPFCGAVLSNADKYSVLQELKVSDLKPLFSATTLLEQFDIDQRSLETGEGTQAVKDRLLLLFKISEELQKISKFCNTPKTALLEVGLPNLSVDECIYQEFPQLKTPIERVLQKSAEINALLGSMKSVFNGIIKQNCNKLNIQLKRLSVPYRFKVSSAAREAKTAEYLLVHKDSDKADDMRECLSTGEKNLVALLLFLSNPEGDVLFIDDPASSFDDYRRTQIYDLIQQVTDKTVLVVSHDQAFVKRAVIDMGKRPNLGKVQAMSRHTGRIEVTDISAGDIVYLPDEIRSRLIEAPSYWQKAINLRLLCDLKKATIKDAWGYSSMILHKSRKTEINARLSESNTDEKAVLEEIEQTLGISMPPVPDDFPESLDMGRLTQFEQLIALREAIDPNKSELDKLHQKMLNDLVHMNDATAYCLNPYKYQLWSPELSALLEA